MFNRCSKDSQTDINSTSKNYNYSDNLLLE